MTYLYIARKLRAGKKKPSGCHPFGVLEIFRLSPPHATPAQASEHYRVRSNTIEWIKDFLTYRQHQVLLDGVQPSQADYLSGVSQGTVLGQLLFLAFIKDMPEVTTSNTRLFADDGLLYRVIDLETDSIELQKDLDALHEWDRTWQMHFKPEKMPS